MQLGRQPVATKQWQRAILAATVSPEPLPLNIQESDF